MKQQTFIVCLENENNITINFERFADKQLKTVQRKYINFMKNMRQYNWYMNDIKQAVVLRIYKTEYETSPNNMVYSIPFDEFLNSLNNN